MPIMKINDVEIDYLDEGEGEPIHLIHGFASNKQVNWVDTGWIKLLVENGYRVIAHDNRGHGNTTKFHHADDYSLELMAQDAFGMLAALDVKNAHVMGYSMGARISARLAIEKGASYNKFIFAGNGDAMVKPPEDWTLVRDGLLAESLSDVTDLRARAFRKFADATNSDCLALAECVTAVRQTFSKHEFTTIENQVLVAVGSQDEIAGSGEALAQMMNNAQFLPIDGRDHMRAVGDPVYKQGVLEFLQG